MSHSTIQLTPILWSPVCQKLLEAAVSVVCTFDISLEIVMLFISALPREFTDYGGK